MTYQGINHLALITNDMDKTVRFYRDVLGMPLVGTIGGDIGGVPTRHYFFGIGERSTIAFFEWQDVELPPRKDSGVKGSGRNFDHVSINVESEDALLALQRRGRDQGVPVSEVVNHGFVHSVYFEDPNGISLEFSYMAGTYEEPFYGDPEPVAAVRE